MNKVAYSIIFLIFRYVDLLNLLGKGVMRSESLYKLLLIPGFESFRWRLGVWRAWRNYEEAYSQVPAYKKFINSHGGKPQVKISKKLLPDLSVIPETDKQNYVLEYSNEQRVMGGRIPKKGVMIDESSGSSGRPTSWVRGPVERAMTKQMLQLGFHRSMRDESTFVINAFALGAWATGLNVSMSLTDITIMKSTGPDLDKIVNTLLEFGSKYHYIVMGYPPFLKTLADDERIKWDEYKIDCAFGGEGISESLREYLLEKFGRVVGSYGASDLEINMASESPFTIELRKLLISDDELRGELIKEEYGVTPMIFQYNPLAYYIESNEKGEMVVTLCRPYNIAPKIRYNIHDRGHVALFSDIVKVLKKQGKWKKFEKMKDKIDLPVLFLYGRSDMSIDYYGANVTPDGVREVLFSIDSLARQLNTFKLVSYEDGKHNKKMIVELELKKDVNAQNFNTEKLGKEVFSKLALMNRDFYNAYYHTATQENMPVLGIHEFGTGPFDGGQKKLKNEYIANIIKYDRL